MSIKFYDYYDDVESSLALLFRESIRWTRHGLGTLMLITGKWTGSGTIVASMEFSSFSKYFEQMMWSVEEAPGTKGKFKSFMKAFNKSLSHSL